MDVAAGEVEALAFGPDQLDGVDPFLRVVVARFVIALRDAEHLEFVLVPADDDVQPEAPFADVVGGHHLLGRDDEMEQRRMHRAEASDSARRRQQRGRPR